MDAITSLKADHDAVEKLFVRFERAGPRAAKARTEIVERIVHDLAVHSAVEQHVFYPAVLEVLPDARDYLLASHEEHDLAAWLSIGLEGMDADQDRFAARAGVLIAEVRYHVHEEEAMLFPEARAALGRSRLAELVADMDDIRARASGRPHLLAPGSAPAGILAGVVGGAVDRARDVGRRAMEEARHAAS